MRNGEIGHVGCDVMECNRILYPLNRGGWHRTWLLEEMIRDGETISSDVLQRAFYHCRTDRLLSSRRSYNWEKVRQHWSLELGGKVRQRAYWTEMRLNESERSAWDLGWLNMIDRKCHGLEMLSTSWRLVFWSSNFLFNSSKENTIPSAECSDHFFGKMEGLGCL